MFDICKLFSVNFTSLYMTSLYQVLVCIKKKYIKKKISNDLVHPVGSTQQFMLILTTADGITSLAVVSQLLQLKGIISI